MATTLPLTSIRTDGGTQSRVKIDPEAVADYAAAYKERAAMPPLTVYHDGKEYWLADGFHRFQAAEKAGLLTVRCDVKRGTKKDAAWHSVGANRQHGLRRTNADKQKAVRMALELHPERSDRDLARHIGVDHKTVSAVRHQLGNFPSCLRKGMDGKTRRVPTPKVGSPGKPPVQPLEPPPPPEPPAGDAPPEPPDPPGDEEPADDAPPPPEDAEAAPRDENDVEVPERRLELWGRRQEVQDMMTALSRIRGALTKAQEKDDELFRPVNYSSAIAAVAQARSAIEVALRRYVCPMCQGDGCRLCRDTGLLGQFAWDTYLPPEFKK